MSTEPTAVEVIAEALLAEGAAPGSSLHSWRCEYPDRYGECDCVPQTAKEILAALKAAGFVVATRDEIRAMSPSEQAELIGGRVWTAKPGSTCGQVRGLWREVQP